MFITELVLIIKESPYTKWMMGSPILPWLANIYTDNLESILFSYGQKIF